MNFPYAFNEKAIGSAIGSAIEDVNATSFSQGSSSVSTMNCYRTKALD